MSTKLHLPFIEAKHKDVDFSPSFVIRHNNQIAMQHIMHLSALIDAGTKISKDYYSKKRYKQLDELLQSHGIMHLHYGNPNTNKLIYLIQYDDAILFLEAADHKIFKDDAGGTLLASHGKAVSD